MRWYVVIRQHWQQSLIRQVFSSEKTQFSEDFADFETEIEPLRKGIER